MKRKNEKKMLLKKKKDLKSVRKREGKRNKNEGLCRAPLTDRYEKERPKRTWQRQKIKLGKTR